MSKQESERADQIRNEPFRRNSGGPLVLVGALRLNRTASKRGWVKGGPAWSIATAQFLRNSGEYATARTSCGSSAAEQHDIRVSEIGACESPCSAHAVPARSRPGNMTGQASNPTSNAETLPAITEAVMPLRRSDDILLITDPIH